MLFPTKKTQNVVANPQRRDSTTIGMDHKGAKADAYSESPDSRSRADVSDEEWINAQRSIRQLSGAACFYLITTDILGPFGMAYSFASVGWA